jgi:anti-sigma regulatory factor (Ser/Thr protein kinase)
MADFAVELTAQQDAISALTERIASHLAAAGVDARAVHHVALVLDELLTNLVAHGSAGAPVSVSLTISPDRVTAEVVDGGPMFEPRVAQNLQLSADVENRPIGGLGLLLVHRVTDDLVYERVGRHNRTTFSICRTPAGQKR